jgi:hypothetical protein
MTVDDLPHPKLPFLQLTMQCIEILQNATHENAGYPEGLLQQITQPLQEAFDMNDPDIRLCVEIFIHTQNASRESYELICQAVHRHNPAFQWLTWAKINRRLASWTGVHLMRFDMCPKGCVGYTGDFSDLENCPDCGESRYDTIALAVGKKVSRQQFFVVPPAPQLQARWVHPDRAQQMKYGVNAMRENIKLQDNNNGTMPHLNDVFSGACILDHFEDPDKGVGDWDVMALYGCDGAQLYASRMSDCWFGALVILNLPPDRQYKQEEVCPVLIIPGPHKPKNMDSFNYPVFHQFRALMKQGCSIIDGDSVDATQHTSFLHLLLAAADGPGLTTLDGGVGHSGAAGCRVHCPWKGRHKFGSGTYYPALQRPDPYDVPSCAHPDGIPAEIAGFQPDEQLYLNDMARILNADTDAVFARERLRTGFKKPSLLLGLEPSKMIRMPAVLCLDFMHFPALNAPDLLIPLFRGTFRRDASDKDPWPWSNSLSDDQNWNAHGDVVARKTRWIPGWYGHRLRNPALKIHSNFKAWEFMLYIYCLGPIVFREHLPEEYWTHFCKLVRIIELSGQISISANELCEIDRLARTWQLEYKELYVKRKSERLHFVRPWIHLLLHLANEIYLKGPPAYYAQWTVERMIGYLKEGLRLHSNPYANLAWVATRLCQINALKAMAPELITRKRTVFEVGTDLGDGFVSLHPRDSGRRPVTASEARALDQYMADTHLEPDNHWRSNHAVLRWARLATPNGSEVCTEWKEAQKSPEDVLVSRHAEVSLSIQLEGRCYVEHTMRLFTRTKNDMLKSNSSVIFPSELLKQSLWLLSIYSHRQIPHGWANRTTHTGYVKKQDQKK